MYTIYTILVEGVSGARAYVAAQGAVPALGMILAVAPHWPRRYV